MTASLHIVRRYGRVGGMENYVWELTHSLVRSGQSVRVICQTCEEKTHAAIEVIELGSVRPKPRWVAQLRFSRNVSRYLHSHAVQDEIIHSHERTAVHHVTTFHGPPFLLRKKRLLDFLSPRIHAWMYLEKRELTAQQVKAILPNSDLIADQLRKFYPQVSSKIESPAYPGVASSFSTVKSESDGKTIGFLGKEWKRKGLDIAIEIIKRIRQQDPEITFLVAGCNKAEIAPLFSDWDLGYQLLDWVKPEEFMGKIDLLIHPARSEPFGMVIAEANAAKIPVVISDQCGIKSFISDQQGKVIPANASLEEWAYAILIMLKDKPPIIPLELSWGSLAEHHISLYQRLQKITQESNQQADK